MTKYAAEHLLGLTGSYNKLDLNQAFREKVRKYHPDLAAAHGEDPIVAGELMTQINEAKSYLEPMFEHNETITCSSTPNTSNVSSTAQHTTNSASTNQGHSQDVPDSEMGYNPDGSWNMNPPWRYETGEEWENYDPEPENYGKDGPYGGWGMNHPWGKAYFQGCQKEAVFNARQRQHAEAVRERDRKLAEERERGPKPDPVEQFRWHDGPMPDDLKRRYEKVSNFHYRLVFTLICFVFCLSYVICDLAQMPIRDDSLYVATAYAVFFLGAINLFTGWITNPIRDARLRRLDRKLAAWRARNA